MNNSFYQKMLEQMIDFVEEQDILYFCELIDTIRTESEPVYKVWFEMLVDNEICATVFINAYIESRRNLSEKMAEE